MKKLFKSTTYHKRFEPKVNEFVNKGFYIRFDIDKLSGLSSTLFKVNRLGVFSFYNKDHGYRDGKELRAWALDQLEKANVNDIGKIELQTFPRVLGYVFNPVSFWFCYRGDEVVAVINEVNNTFGETHTYIVKKGNSELPKEFHVSPFLDVKGRYEFKYLGSSVHINYYDHGQLVLNTSISGHEIKWSDKSFLSLFALHPFYTLSIVMHIHYQALRLYMKGIKFFTLPVKSNKDTTYE